MMRRLAAALLALVVALMSAAPASAQENGSAQPDPPGSAGCRPPQLGGSPIHEGAGPEPVIARLGLERAGDLSKGEGVTVAVVDSGLDYSHPKFEDAIASGGAQFVAVPDPRVSDQLPAAPIDCENHGTIVAGLIAARPGADNRVVGVAPEALIRPVLVDDIEQFPALAKAILFAAGSGAEVMNLSFALPVNRPEIQFAIEQAVRNDIVVVAAAGNGGQSDPRYPAAYKDVIAVAAVGLDSLPWAESNRGSWVDIAAPGEDLTSTSTGGSGFVTVDGTSFATALVSGVAALIRSRFPDASAAEVRERLIGSAVPVSGTTDERVGAGMVDPYMALTYLPPSGRDWSADPGSVQPAPLPEPDPVLSAGQATALAWAGGVVLVGALALIGGPVVRRAAARGWVARPPGKTQRDDTGPPPTPPRTTLR